MTLYAWLTRRWSGLGFRLMSVMGLALLPLALLSYVQGLQTVRLSDSRVASAILGETLVAAAPLTAEVVKAQGKAATLAATLPSILRAEANGEAGACRAVMDDVVSASIGMVTFAGYIPRDGQMVCASGGVTRDYAGNRMVEDMFAANGPLMSVNSHGSVSQTSVLMYSSPVRDAMGAAIGVVVLSMPHFSLEAHSRAIPQTGAQPLSLITFDAAGTLLTSSSGLEGASAFLPATHVLPDLAARPGQSFVAETPGGQRRAFAAVTLQPGTLYLLGSWPADRLNTGMLEGAFPAFLFPALMWAASLLVAWLAAEAQVLRHVRSLRDGLGAFASGDRKLARLDMADAAVELRVVGRAYERMAEAVIRNEADLENTIHQKEVLLREVHHRVKNNLQLIASIMNMQLRSARTAEAREAMRNVQERVISLATVHRELYQTSGLTDVRADELLPRVARDLLRIGAVPGRRFDLSTEIDGIHLTPDQAVPLALFLTEGMANVLKHAWSGGAARSDVALRLKRLGSDRAVFSLTNSLTAEGTPVDPNWIRGSDGFGTQLLNAFATQLSGRIARGREGDRYRLELEFPICPLAHAEERSAPAAIPVTQEV